MIRHVFRKYSSHRVLGVILQLKPERENSNHCLPMTKKKITLDARAPHCENSGNIT